MKRQYHKALFSMLLLGFTAAVVPCAEADVSKEVEIRVSHRLGEVHVIVAGQEVTGDHGLPLKDGLEIELPKRSNVSVRVVDTNFFAFEYGIERKTVDAPWTEQLATFGQALGNAFKATSAAKARSSSGEETTSDVACPSGAKQGGNLQKVVNDLKTWGDKRKQYVADSLNKPAEEVIGSNAEWQLAGISKRLTAIEVERATLEDNFEACVEWITFIDVNLPKARALWKELEAFDKVLKSLGDPVELEGFQVEHGKFQEVKIHIASKDAWTEEQKARGMFKFVGDAKISVQPQSKVDISVTPTAVYSFVRDPTFDVVEEDGELSIRKQEEPYKKLDLAAMLLIEPRDWDLGPLGVGVQLGVAPAGDLGFFLGLALRSGDRFTFGAGIAYQEVEVLGAGLAEGPISSRDDFKTDSAFETGLYIHLSVSVGGNKK